MLFYTKKNKITLETAHELAINAFSFLANDPTLVKTFLNDSGLTLAQLADFTKNPKFSLSIIHFYLNHEKALINCAAALKINPESFKFAHDELIKA